MLIALDLSRRGDFVAPLRNFIDVISFFYVFRFSAYVLIVQAYAIVYVASPLKFQQRSDDLCQLVVLQKETIVAELGCDFMVDRPGNA